MGRMIDDSVKQKLLNSLAEEPAMVLSTAYAYAKNYVMYGEDITKAWTTAVQQVSVIQEVRQKTWVEAYDSFKKEYENRLKAEKLDLLKDLLSEIEEYKLNYLGSGEEITQAYADGLWKGCRFIQQKINALKENKDGSN